MAEFTHFIATSTSPNPGSWLSLFSAPSNWSQVELTATSWTIRATAQSQFVGWTVKVTSATGFAADASGIPTGVVASMEVRNAEGALVATVRELGGLGVQARDMAVSPSLLFAGNDTFTGSAGDDHFWGGTGVDSISGGAGNDNLYAQSGVVDGGAGFDYFQGSGLPPSATETGVAVSNVETIWGPMVNVAPTTTGVTITSVPGATSGSSAAADFLTGGLGADTITSDWGADTIRPGLGDDYVDAGNPFNTLVYYQPLGRPPTFYYDFDTSRDTLDLSTSPQGVTVDLTLTTAQDTGIGVKTLLGFEVLRGSAYNDTLKGVSYFSNGGSSTTSPIGAVTIYGGAGDDRITGHVNNDLLMGEAGNDILAGGGGGGDTLDGGAGFDIVDYTANIRAVSITLGASAQSNGDTFVSIEGVIGSAFADTLSSSTAVGGSAFLAGGAGADLMIGAQFDDVLQGGTGADTLTGGSGADKFVLALDGAVDTLTDFNTAEGDVLLLLSDQGAIVSGASGLVIWNAASRQLWWDADSDAGPGAPVLLAQMSAATNFELRGAFAIGFQPSAVRTLAANGSVTATVFDWGSQSFDYTRTTFTAGGKVEVYDVVYDNAATANRSWDVNNTQAWDNRAAEYDPQGRMTAYGVYYDDGSYQVFQFDTANAKPWERLVEKFDALGRIAEQGIKNDDGTASERIIDTYDVQPWAYYIDNYDAAGRLLNHTFYKADGTLYVGG